MGKRQSASQKAATHDVCNAGMEVSALKAYWSQFNKSNEQPESNCVDGCGQESPECLSLCSPMPPNTKEARSVLEAFSDFEVVGSEANGQGQA